MCKLSMVTVMQWDIHTQTKSDLLMAGCCLALLFSWQLIIQGLLVFLLLLLLLHIMYTSLCVIHDIKYIYF